jgi:hypothetical protein
MRFNIISDSTRLNVTAHLYRANLIFKELYAGRLYDYKNRLYLMPYLRDACFVKI